MNPDLTNSSSTTGTTQPQHEHTSQPDTLAPNDHQPTNRNQTQYSLQPDLSPLAPHTHLLLNLPNIPDPILQLQYIRSAAARIIPDPSCPCLFCTGQTTNPLIALEDAVNAVLALPHDNRHNGEGEEETLCGSPNTVESETVLRADCGYDEDVEGIDWSLDGGLRLVVQEDGE